MSVSMYFALQACTETTYEYLYMCVHEYVYICVREYVSMNIYEM